VTFGHPNLGHILPVAKPHGTKQYVDPAAVEQCLEALDLLALVDEEE